VFSGGGTPVADVVAIVVAVAAFAFLFWAIDLIDRIWADERGGSLRVDRGAPGLRLPLLRADSRREAL